MTLLFREGFIGKRVNRLRVSVPISLAFVRREEAARICDVVMPIFVALAQELFVRVTDDLGPASTSTFSLGHGGSPYVEDGTGGTSTIQCVGLFITASSSSQSHA